MKTSAILKRQQFGDSGSDKIEPRGSKRQRLDEYDNKKWNGLGGDEGEIESSRYIPPPFVPLLPLAQKVSNRLSDLGEWIKSLKHIVYIPKICYSRSANFALEFLGKGSSKAQKNLYKPPKRGIRVLFVFHSFYQFWHHQSLSPN